MEINQEGFQYLQNQNFNENNITDLNINEDNITNDITMPYVQELPGNGLNNINNFGSEYILNCPVANFGPTNPSSRVEELSSYNLNKNSKEVINIYNSLLNVALINEIYEPSEEDNEIKNKFTDLLNTYKDFKNDIQKEKQKLLDSEKEFKISYEKIQKDLDKISDFKDFIIKLDEKHKDFIPDKLNDSLTEIIKKINDNNDHLEKKQKLVKQTFIYNSYLDVVKEFNSLNNGSTCNLCLGKQVNTYMEPCGHTACSDCIEELKRRNNEYRINCFICRKEVYKFHKIYFT